MDYIISISYIAIITGDNIDADLLQQTTAASSFLHRKLSPASIVRLALWEDQLDAEVLETARRLRVVAEEVSAEHAAYVAEEDDDAKSLTASGDVASAADGVGDAKTTSILIVGANAVAILRRVLGKKECVQWTLLPTRPTRPTQPTNQTQPTTNQTQPTTNQTQPTTNQPNQPTN